MIVNAINFHIGIHRRTGGCKNTCFVCRDIELRCIHFKLRTEGGLANWVVSNATMQNAKEARECCSYWPG